MATKLKTRALARDVARPEDDPTPARATTPRKKRCPVCGSVPNCHHTPPAQLRVMLATSRRHGIVFDSAWESAWTRVRWPHDTTHRREYKEVLKDQSHVWQAAYERVGEANKRLTALCSLIDRLSADERMAA